MENIRVRFAPSPTGALHIGGIRTALYNYLLAKKYGGTFILRIEDTDQVRYVPGAEEYIVEALRWCGLLPDEGPGFGGEYGPYRQSERKDIYLEYARQLVERGWGYYAFDTPAELDALRAADPNFKYDATVRDGLANSLALPAEEVSRRLAAGEPYTIRLKAPVDRTVWVHDLVRGEVAFQSSELDDKVMLKADGMPTYHLANIVDDHLMAITHVIRGEEWLPSTAHHVLLYEAFGWTDTMPQFAHLPLILKPTGQGKLSKRDGAKFGFPVFPLGWPAEKEEDSILGFRDFGFDPRAMLNFLAFLGWNPGTEQEIFSLEELASAFSVEKISKSGARFDYEKARWYNQQYLMATDEAALVEVVRPLVAAHGHHPTDDFLRGFVGLMRERVVLYPDFWTNGYYFFEPVREYDLATVAKRWQPQRRAAFERLRDRLLALADFEANAIKLAVDAAMAEEALKPGEVLPLLRIALAGVMQGPAVFDMMALLGPTEVANRLTRAVDVFDQAVAG